MHEHSEEQKLNTRIESPLKLCNLVSAATESTLILQIRVGTLLWAPGEADKLSPRTRALTTSVPALSLDDGQFLSASLSALFHLAPLHMDSGC